LPDDIRIDAISELNDLLESKPLLSALENVLYARPLPDEGNLEFSIANSNPELQPLAHIFFLDFERAQQAISKVYDAWEAIPTNVFGDQELRDDFLRLAVREGLFRALVHDAEQPRTSASFASIASYNPRIRMLRNNREVLQRWSKRVQSGSDILSNSPDRSLDETAEI
jgi:hypothetical protein